MCVAKKCVATHKILCYKINRYGRGFEEKD